MGHKGEKVFRALKVTFLFTPRGKMNRVFIAGEKCCVAERSKAQVSFLFELWLLRRGTKRDKERDKEREMFYGAKWQVWVSHGGAKIHYLSLLLAAAAPLIILASNKEHQYNNTYDQRDPLRQ